METQFRRITWGMALRMGADALMLQMAMFVALAGHLLMPIAFGDMYSNYDLRSGVNARLSDYFKHAPGLTFVCVAIMFLMGIYTYGRFYQGRYRALVLFQGITQGFVAYGFIAAQLSHPGAGRFPISAFVAAWFIASVLIISSRMWSRVWETIIHPEREAILLSRRGPERHVLVIGGAGYIGSALLGKLLARGHKVRLLDMMAFGEDPIRDVADHPNLEIVRGDFRHVEVVVRALQGVDSLIHLGAIVGDPACQLDEELTIDVNLSATRMIAELAKAAGVEKLIFASTCSVYGACDELLDERSIVRPISLYGQTKLASERVLLPMADAHFCPIVVRFATIYGLSGRTRFDLVVNLLAAKAKMEGKITVNGGDQWRPFVHVDDAAEAVAQILQAPREIVSGEIFNVGSNEQNYTITQIGQIVHELVPAAELLINTEDTDKRNYRVAFDKIRNLLNFTPRWTVEQGISQVLEAIASGDVQDYTATKYSNVKHLTETGTQNLAREKWAKELLQDLARQ